MASINRDAFYINFVNLDREETAIILTLMLAALQNPDEILEEMGENIGGLHGIRGRISALGSKLDDDWPAMVKTAAELCNL